MTTGILGSKSTKADLLESPAVLRYWTLAFFAFCLWALFYRLGDAALIEPDEGRNAEIAREIILLKNWLTPHYNFIPRLDKPIGFFSLVALSFKAFGISEWAARLPSALAGLGAVALTYALARVLFGGWAALWSGLVLITSFEFFGLSRIVIIDVVFTLFITAAMICFTLGERQQRAALFFGMYAAMAAAMLLKGPIGILLPVATIFVYLFLRRRWFLLRHMSLPLGALLVIVIAAPWYILAEIHNPGYLRYFLLQENLARFATTSFNRGHPWYFFLPVLCAGFFPWVFLLPTAVSASCRRSVRMERLLLLSWAALPLVVFSLSSSKLAHYILPSFPPLAILVGVWIAERLRQPARNDWFLALGPAAFASLAALLSLALFAPRVLPERYRAYADATLPQISLALTGAWILLLAMVAIAWRTRRWREPGWLFAATAVSFALVILISQPILKTVSLQRSSKLLAQQAISHIGPADRLVLYRGYSSSLPFYLNILTPIAVVPPEQHSTVLGSNYVAREHPKPTPGYGEVLISDEQFTDLWKSTGPRLLVFASRTEVERFASWLQEPPRRLTDTGNTVLIESRQAP